MSRTRSHPKTPPWGILLGLTGIGLLGWFVATVWPLGVFRRVATASPGTLLLAAVAVLTNVTVKAWRWRFMVRSALGLHLTYGKSMAMVPAGVAGAALVPAHAIDLGKPALLALGEGVPFGRSLALAFWERLHDFAALLAFAGITGVVATGWAGGNDRSLTGLSLCLLVAGAAGIVLLIAPGPVLRLGESILGRAPAATTASRAMISGYSCLALIIEAGRAALVAHALGWTGPAWGAPAAFLGGSVAGVLSLVPGGIGVSEWSTGLLLSRLAHAGAGGVVPEAAAVVMVDRLLAYYLPAMAGALLITVWQKLFRSSSSLGARDRLVDGRAESESESAHVSSDPTPHTWVVLPAYNEASDIGRLIHRVVAALPAGRYHVVLVDDGSRDDTARVAREAAGQAGCPLSVVQHRRNEGLPSALRDGLRWASQHAAPGDVVVCMDADNTQDPQLISELARRLARDSDVAIASRYRRGAGEVGVPLGRRILSRGVNTLLSLAMPLPGVRDYTSGFRAYRASTLRDAFDRFGDGMVESRTFACTAEVLLRLGSLGARMGEVPMVLRYDQKRGRSKIRVLPTVLEYLRLTGRMALQTPKATRRLLWTVALVLFLVPVAAPLTDGDSHYYATIAQEMIRSNDWVTPRDPAAPGSIVDKPPLTLWMMALSFRLLGTNEVAARSWQVLMALVVLWLTVDVGRMYMSERAALRAGWILLTAGLFWYSVLVPQQDVATLFFLTVAFWAFLRFRRGRGLLAYHLMWVAMAGEVLTRGILGVALAGAVLTAFMLVSKLRPGRLFASGAQALAHTLIGFGLFLGLGLGWYAFEAVALGPRFVEVFFTGGNARFFSGAPAATGVSLVLGYVPLLALAFVPWSGWLPGAIGLAFRRLGASRRPGGPVDEVRSFTLIWAVVAFAAPHLIAWRVIRYLLPVVPALALLVADWLDARESCPERISQPEELAARRDGRWAYGLSLALLGPLGLGALALTWVVVPPEAEPIKPLVQLFLSVFGAGALLYARTGRRNLAAGGRVLIATALSAYLVLGAALAVHGDRAFPRRLQASESLHVPAAASGTPPPARAGL